MSHSPDRRRALLAGSASVAILFALAFALPAYLLRSHSQESSGAATVAHKTIDREPFEGAQSAPPRTPGETRASDAELTRRITLLIDDGEAAARWGVHVVSLRDGRVLYARDANRLFTPASNMKLYTTAVALDLLGPDYRWRTSVYAATAPDATGTITGDLVLYGRGAPDLSSRPAKDGRPAQLASLVEELRRRGVRRVGGDVVGDESFFRGEALGAGWLWEDVQWYYGAEPSALSIDDNEAQLNIAPGKAMGAPVEVKLIPATDYMRVTNEMKTVERGARPVIGVTRELSSNETRVWGEFPAGGASYDVRLSVRRPALLAAKLFREALLARGIEVAGDARAVDARTPEEKRLDVARGVELASIESETLGEVVRETNKKSLNLQAELLLRAVGTERGDMAPEADPARTLRRDTDVAGLAVIRRWLEQAGVDTSALALRDGSGLSRFNLITPGTTTRLLVRMSRAPAARAFRDSLPLAGQDGTLAYRFRRSPSGGQLAAKTGFFTHVNALSGYALTADGEPLAFSIICNDEARAAASRRIIDALAALLTAYPNIDKATPAQ